ncbi:MAG: tyrosine-type recombinase/integrase [Acidimicrobiales bacterium]
MAANTSRSKRRGHGEGSIYRRDTDGRWVGSVNLGWENGRRRRKVVYGKTQAEVVRKIKKLNTDISRGLPPPDDRSTVEQLLRRWLLDVVPGRVSPSTLHDYRVVAERHIIPVLGKKKLTALSPADVQTLLRTKQESRLPQRVHTKKGLVERPTAGGYSPRTIKLIRGVLGQALGQAERWGMVARNVVALTDGPREAQTEGRTLTPEQARSLLRAASGERLEAAFVLMLSLGLRKGEVFGLRWSDVDFKDGVISIAQALSRVDSRLVLGPPKTERSRRKVNLPREVATSLRTHKTRQATERLALGDAWQDTGLVFTNEIGAPLDPSNFRRTFDRVAVKAGLAGWHPHELRHSCASILLAQGVPLEVVSRVLGHSSIRITADVYGHILDPQREKAAEAMSAALWNE